MLKSATARTTLLPPSHELWKPHSYQHKATEFLLTHGAGALFADPGIGKTSIVLNAVIHMRKMGVADKILVIAPRRVCQLVWWQESQRWTQFRHLKFAWLHNSKAPWDADGRTKRKEDELKKDADIYLINPEGVPWLHKQFPQGRGFPFDTVVVDEITKFKNARANRSKDLRKLTKRTKRIWGLTGSPTPNGYEDLFGQILLLDGGHALGKWFTHFRERFFEPDGFTGYNYKLRRGADKRIEKAIAPLVMRISAKDFLKLPKRIDAPRLIELDPKSQRLYDTLKKEMLLKVEDGVVTAANSAALYSKLSQLANGRVYLETQPGMSKLHTKVHDAKTEALRDLVEELAGAPLIVGYEFNHDLEAIRDTFKDTNIDLRVLGKGTSDKEALQIEKDWNAGKITVLAAHPQSAGHGLNFQRGNACHVCWFSATWDFELYDQFIQRILRQGNKAPRVINHLLLVKGSIDELKYEALQDKDMTQERFLQAINTAFHGEPNTRPRGNAAGTTQETKMGLAKLRTKKAADADAAAENTEAEEASSSAPVKPKGWDKGGDDDDAQREEIASKLGKRQETDGAGEGDQDDDGGADTPSTDEAFSEATKAAMADSEKAPAKPKTKRKSTKKATVAAPEPVAAPRPFINVSAKIIESENGDPRISVSSTYGITDDMEEDTITRAGELAAAGAEAAYLRLAGEDE